MEQKRKVQRNLEQQKVRGGNTFPRSLALGDKYEREFYKKFLDDEWIHKDGNFPDWDFKNTKTGVKIEVKSEHLPDAKTHYLEYKNLNTMKDSGILASTSDWWVICRVNKGTITEWIRIKTDILLSIAIDYKTVMTEKDNDVPTLGFSVGLDEIRKKGEILWKLKSEKQ
jgi:hypothetical protein